MDLPPQPTHLENARVTVTHHQIVVQTWFAFKDLEHNQCQVVREVDKVAVTIV